MSAEYGTFSQQEVQTLYHMIDSLKEYEKGLQETIDEINSLLRNLIKCGYYNRVSITFRCRLYETILFYQGSRADLAFLQTEMATKITEEQIASLHNLANTAENLHTSLRFSWKVDSYPEDFSEKRFISLAYVYKEAANMLKKMESLETLAEELEEYVGK